MRISKSLGKSIGEFLSDELELGTCVHLELEALYNDKTVAKDIRHSAGRIMGYCEEKFFLDDHPIAVKMIEAGVVLGLGFSLVYGFYKMCQS